VRAKLATPVALVAAVVLFAGVFVLTQSLIWSPLVAVVGAFGVYLMLDARTPVQVRDDTYAEDAERKVAEALQLVRDVRKLSREVTSTAARGSLESACQYVPELLERVRANSPNSLYSSASQVSAHLASLHGALTQYLDIQCKPSLYTNPAALRESGEEAFRRFSDFAFDSVQLVNQGDIATYKANLATVAPPRLPTLGGGADEAP
jgi:hypothetical protein